MAQNVCTPECAVLLGFCGRWLLKRHFRGCGVLCRFSLFFNFLKELKRHHRICPSVFYLIFSRLTNQSQFMKSLIKAAIAFLFCLVAACIASAQTTENLTSKCENCPPQYRASSVSYNGNVNSDHAYPSHVQIINSAVMSVDGTRFVKFSRFGYVFNYPSRSMQLYWLKDKRRLDFQTTKPVLAPILTGAKRFYESFTIIGVGECRFYYDIETAQVTGYTLSHWDFPDASGQRLTREGKVNEY